MISHERIVPSWGVRCPVRTKRRPGRLTSNTIYRAVHLYPRFPAVIARWISKGMSTSGGQVRVVGSLPVGQTTLRLQSSREAFGLYTKRRQSLDSLYMRTPDWRIRSGCIPSSRNPHHQIERLNNLVASGSS
jgi:hypothetical protein